MKHAIAITIACCAFAAVAANRSYCRITNEGRSVVYAPDYVWPSPLTPTAADYFAAGWLKNGILPPSPPTGYTCTNTIYRAQGEAVVAVYAYGPAPVVPRKFSKLKIYGAIAQLGAWSQIQAWLESKTIEGVNGWMAFQLAQEISEDHALFAALAEEARQLLGLTQEQFDALLDECILED